jgi:RNA polymerase sigma-70 factor, ECF subfamily
MPGARQGLLTEAAAGDVDAVRECVASFGGVVWGLARRLSPSRADAEDAVQEIFLDLWAHGSRYDPARASQEAFVAVIARRRLIDRRRRASRRLALEPIEVAEPVSREVSAETVAEAGLAARAMKDLRPEQREVLRLSVAQGLTHQEISEHTGMPLGTVKAHARRGLLRIRGILSGEGAGEGVREEEMR